MNDHFEQRWTGAELVSVPCSETHPDPWGEPWGPTPYITTEGVVVVLRRKAQRCRFVNHQGEVVGPEHRNVVPAIIWASANGWTDPSMPTWLANAMRDEIQKGTK